MDSLPPPSSWFSAEEIKRHAEGFIMGAATILGVQNLGWWLTGKTAKTMADLAVANEKIIGLEADVIRLMQERDEARSERDALKAKLPAE